MAKPSTADVVPKANSANIVVPSLINKWTFTQAAEVDGVEIQAASCSVFDSGLFTLFSSDWQCLHANTDVMQVRQWGDRGSCKANPETNQGHGWKNKKKNRKNTFYLFFSCWLRTTGRNKTKLLKVIDRGPKTATNLSTNIRNSNGQKDISECKTPEMFWLLFLFKLLIWSKWLQGCGGSRCTKVWQNKLLLLQPAHLWLCWCGEIRWGHAEEVGMSVCVCVYVQICDKMHAWHLKHYKCTHLNTKPFSL